MDWSLISKVASLHLHLVLYPPLHMNYAPTPRTAVRRLKKRAVYDKDEVHAILDEGFVCHVGFVVEDQPYVIPTLYARENDCIYFHGAMASRMLRTLTPGVNVCVTVTLIDGLVLARSAAAFLAVKYLGAAYLIYLGIQTLRSGNVEAAVAKPELQVKSPFWQGTVTEVLNPKTALFFLAFIPQFVDHAARLVPQFLALGAISVALNTAADVVIVMAAAPLARRLESSAAWRNRQRQASGAALIGLGGYVASRSN